MPKVLQCTRENMLEKARSLLIEKGYDACTMREVAAACGVSVGTMYTFFSSKDAMIVHAVAAEWFEVLEGVKSLSSLKSWKMEYHSKELSGSGEFLYGMITNSNSVFIKCYSNVN